MKKIFLITALTMIFTLNLSAETLKFITNTGLELTITIKKEKEEPLPEFVVKAQNSEAYRIFDISELSKPEKEEDVPDFIKKIKN